MQALLRHGLRNAAVPVVTVLALQLATLLVGSVVIERVFVIPGLGSLLLDSVSNRDLIMVQDVVMIIALAVLLVKAEVREVPWVLLATTSRSTPSSCTRNSSTEAKRSAGSVAQAFAISR